MGRPAVEVDSPPLICYARDRLCLNELDSAKTAARRAEAIAARTYRSRRRGIGRWRLLDQFMAFMLALQA